MSGPPKARPVKHTCGIDGDPGAVTPMDGKCEACDLVPGTLVTLKDGSTGVLMSAHTSRGPIAHVWDAGDPVTAEQINELRAMMSGELHVDHLRHRQLKYCQTCGKSVDRANLDCSTHEQAGANAELRALVKRSQTADFATMKEIHAERLPPSGEDLRIGRFILLLFMAAVSLICFLGANCKLVATP